MWPFKKKVIKPIEGAVWGHLHSKHKIDVDTLSKEMRCVEREQVIEGSGPVTFLRVFKPREAEQRGINVTGWETFDEHPHLRHFEGYIIKKTNEVSLERKSA